MSAVVGISFGMSFVVAYFVSTGHGKLMKNAEFIELGTIME